MMKHLIAYLTVLLLCTGVLHAQDWDRALDQYEQICDQCIALRNRSLAGEKVAATEAAPLLAQLSTLRQTLRQADGTMTEAQQERYTAIRRRYEAAFGMRQEPISAIEAVPYFPLLPSVLPALKTPQPVPLAYTPRPGVTMTAALYVRFPDGAPGLMVGVSRGRWGGFVKGSCSFAWPRAAYDCHSDGTTDGGYIWTSGKESSKRYSVVAGGTFSPLPFLGVYAGAGYGKRTLFWEDTGGNWARVQDRSMAGAAVDVGVLFTWKHFTALAGISTIGMRHVAGEVGVGVRFDRTHRPSGKP